MIESTDQEQGFGVLSSMRHALAFVLAITLWMTRLDESLYGKMINVVIDESVDSKNWKGGERLVDLECDSCSTSTRGLVYENRL
jgi:hypothetical protein